MHNSLSWFPGFWELGEVKAATWKRKMMPHDTPKSGFDLDLLTIGTSASDLTNRCCTKSFHSQGASRMTNNPES